MNAELHIALSSMLHEWRGIWRGPHMFDFPSPARSDAHELLDSPSDHGANLHANLRDIRRLNSWFGGTLLAVKTIGAEVEGLTHARVLDVATGSADIPLALRRWGTTHGVALDIVGSDVSSEVLAEARRCIGDATIRLARADARTLPWKDASFDVVSCCLALHHFAPADTVKVLQEMWRVASRCVVVTDLRRGYAGYAGAWVVTHSLAPNVLTRHDGPLSVLRAYTPRELRDLAATAGLSSVSVQSRRFFRQVLVAKKGGGASHG